MMLIDAEDESNYLLNTNKFNRDDGIAKLIVLKNGYIWDINKAFINTIQGQNLSGKFIYDILDFNKEKELLKTNFIDFLELDV